MASRAKLEIIFPRKVMTTAIIMIFLDIPVPRNIVTMGRNMWTSRPMAAAFFLPNMRTILGIKGTQAKLRISVKLAAAAMMLTSSATYL